MNKTWNDMTGEQFYEENSVTVGFSVRVSDSVLVLVFVSVVRICRRPVTVWLIRDGVTLSDLPFYVIFSMRMDCACGTFCQLL